MQAIIGLGSNIGNKQRHLLDAARALEWVPGIVPLALSNGYGSAPIGPPQPRYSNAALLVETTWKPAALLAALHGIEAALGRRRSGSSPRWGPRRVDLDLLLAGDRVINEPELKLPHPRLRERAFALIPMIELCPEAVDPLSGERYREVADRLGPADVTLDGPLPASIGRTDIDDAADRAIVVVARTQAEVAEAAVSALLDAMFDRRRVVERERRLVEIQGDDPAKRLAALLGELPLLLNAQGFVAKRATLLHHDRKGAQLALFGETLHDEEQVQTIVRARTPQVTEVARTRRGQWRASIIVAP